MRHYLDVTRRPERRRGLRGQRRLRRCERATRIAAVEFARDGLFDGARSCEIAAALGLDPGTLCRWMRAWKSTGLAYAARGRPVAVADEGTRRAAYDLLGQNPTLGVPTLCKLCPALGTREAAELARRWRQATRRLRRRLVFSLRWTRPGSVWAIDFSEPPAPVNGIYDQLLCVRDLPSHYEIWAQPTLGKTVKTVLDALTALVRWYGAPLALKLDNDGVFRSRAVREWAERHGVLLLFSPPRTPEYNGAIESGMGRLKIAAHVVSAGHGRPGEWLVDDLQEALARMNEEARPCGFDGPNALELWNDRDRATDDERSAFHERFARHLQEESDARGLDPGVQWQHTTRSAVERDALTKTLIRYGYLELRRRRITLAVSRWKGVKITS